MTTQIKNEIRSKMKPSRALYKKTYRNTLKSARVHHKTSKNAFSRVLHAKGMDSLHEYLALALFNPKILLAGAVSSLLGEIFSISMSEIFGYSYNYLLFAYFFVLGYVLSMVYLTLTSKLKK
jgi:hypothetical protein